MAEEFLPMSTLADEAQRLIQSLGCNELEIPLTTRLTTNGKEFHLEAQYRGRVAFCRWLHRQEDLELSLGDYSERILKPAAFQCVQILNA